jgi:septal ring factor EnvC (AmiA/AmiB activator)
MLGMMAESLAVISLVAAGVAIVWLSIIRKQLSALGKRILESEDIGKILQAAEKVGTFESRMTGCENKTGESQKQLSELQSKVNESASKIESIETKSGRNENGLAEIVPSIKNLAEEIQNLQKFQTATKKTHSLIQAAFTEMGARMSFEEGEEMTSHVTEPEQISNEPETEHQEVEDQNIPEPEMCNSSIEENTESWRIK